MMFRRFLLLCSMALALSACSASISTGIPQELSRQEIVLASPAGEEVRLSVEAARTEEERAIGLMGRTTVTTGMLFLFEQEQPLAFWMKNTLVPLDVLYFRADGSFVSSQSMPPCTADPCPSYLSEGPARFALEMPEGFVSGKGVGSGWTLDVGLLGQ